MLFKCDRFFLFFFFHRPSARLGYSIQWGVWAEVSYERKPARRLKTAWSDLFCFLTVWWRKPRPSIPPNVCPHEQRRMCGHAVLHKGRVQHTNCTAHKYSTEWRAHSTVLGVSTCVPISARAHVHTRSSGEYPRMRGGCPLPFLLSLTYSK